MYKMLILNILKIIYQHLMSNIYFTEGVIFLTNDFQYQFGENNLN